MLQVLPRTFSGPHSRNQKYRVSLVEFGWWVCCLLGLQDASRNDSLIRFAVQPLAPGRPSTTIRPCPPPWSKVVSWITTARQHTRIWNIPHQVQVVSREFFGCVKETPTDNHPTHKCPSWNGAVVFEILLTGPDPAPRKLTLTKNNVILLTGPAPGPRKLTPTKNNGILLKRPALAPSKPTPTKTTSLTTVWAPPDTPVPKLAK
jgi:hypothetical protein